MGIDRSLADRKLNHFCEFPKQTTPSNRKNRRRHKKMPSPSPVQQLYKICNDVFASSATEIVPPSADIERIRSVLDKMKPVDVGLSPGMSYFRTTAGQQTTPPPITYLHIYESTKFSMGIFCLPPSGVIPLHNHPGMTVFSKLLFGTMHIKAYDWAEVGGESSESSTVDTSNGTSPPSGIRLAKVKVDADFMAPCDASILYPADGGNIHCFTAVTACAVLDVLGPPYNDRDGRHCSYYLNFPFTKFSVDGVSVTDEERESYEWLEEREQPKDLAAVGAPYRGPKIVEN